MCELSEKLKLCTCGAGSVRGLDHYWVLHRFRAGKDDFVIGRVRPPDTIDEKVEAHNRALLLARLNEDDAFDVDLSPREGDRLELSFRCAERGASGQANMKHIVYGYAFTSGRWVEEPYDPLSWSWHHDDEHFGEIRPALAG